MSVSLQGANNLTCALSSAGLGIGSTTSQLSTANAITYVLNGRFQASRAAAATIPLVIEPNTGIVPTAPNVLQNVPAGASCTLALIVDSAGVFTVAQGDIVLSTSQLCPVPIAPAAKAIVGVAKIVNASASPFIFATTAFNAAGVTTTYTNLAVHTGSPV